MFSINPLFPGTVMGGAPKHLQSIAIYLGEQGHQVSILCTRADGSPRSFQWQDNVTIHPILHFKQPFPQPYAVPAYAMANAMQDLRDFLEQADRFYMHDGEFLFPFVYQDVPTVISLRDNVYPETLVGGFLAQADRLILISEYSRVYFQQTVGRFFPEFDTRTQVIYNGLDWDKFRPTQPDEILKIIPVDYKARPVVLHPHRPEESKGLLETIQVIDHLVHHHRLTDVIGLAPRWLDAQLTPDLRDFYDRVQTMIHERGLSDNFYFHDWVPQALMPQYFSMGDVTLSLGHFVESFGNAVYESLGCGTPSVAARISTHRELLPETLLDKVDYGDTQAAADAVARIINNNERPAPATLDYLHTHYSVLRQRQAYAEAILNATVVPPLRYQPAPRTASTRYRLPVWCYRTGNGIYHDFNADYRPEGQFAPLLDQYPDGFRLDQAVNAGIPPDIIENWYRDGYLVPLSEHQD